MTLLPTPLRLKSSFVWKTQLGGIALIMVGLVAVAGYAWWQYASVKELIDQSRIWREGTMALKTTVEGSVTSHSFILNDYDLDVTFLDENQVLHQGKLEFSTLISTIDRDREPEVRYGHDDPEKFALSWAMNAKISRWAAIAFMAVVGVGLVGGSFAYIGVMALRRLADARCCALRSNEVVVRITQIVPTKAKGRHVGNQYHFTGRMVDGREVSGKTVFPIKYEPLFADGAKQTMLVLIPQENVKRPVVVRGDFYPFDLTPDEQAKVRTSIAGRRAMAG
jgi:hypothetical protein